MHRCADACMPLVMHDQMFTFNSNTGRVVTLENDVRGMRAQLEEILHYVRPQERVVEREVDDELDSLLSSFSFHSDDMADPLAKAQQTVQHFCGLINPRHALLAMSQSPECATFSQAVQS